MFTLQRAKYLSSIVNAILVISLLSACSRTNEAIEEKDAYHQSAKIEKISPSQFYEVARKYTGKIVSKQNTSLSFEYGGQVIDVYIDSGDSVKKGQLLAKLNTDLLKIKQQEIDATISQLNAQAQLNRLNLARVNELIKKGYSSKQSLDELQTEQKVIKADLSRQQANKSAVNYQISKAQLHAPFDGVVSNRMLAEGEIIRPNQVAFELIKQSHHEIVVGVPVKIARELMIGKSLTVELGQQGFSANIIAIGKQVNQISRTVELRLAITDPLTVYNGQLAQVEIIQRVNQQGFWVPLSALTDGIRGQWNIFRVNKLDNNLYGIVATTIEVKHTTVDSAYITGLAPTEQSVIVSGVHRFVPGQIVKKTRSDNSQLGQSL